MIKEIVSDVMNFRLFKLLTSHILVEIKNALFLSDDSFFLPKKNKSRDLFSPLRRT